MFQLIPSDQLIFFQIKSFSSTSPVSVAEEKKTKGTPFGDTVIEEFAEAAIENESMGKDEVTDFLVLSFSAIDYVGHRYGPNSIEMEDAMIRLDRDLEKLLNFLDAKVGKGEYQLFVTADHAGAPVASWMQSKKIPGGYMNYPLMDSLLNIQITNKFGNFKYS